MINFYFWPGSASPNHHITSKSIILMNACDHEISVKSVLQKTNAVAPDRGKTAIVKKITGGGDSHLPSLEQNEPWESDLCPAGRGELFSPGAYCFALPLALLSPG